MVFSIFFSLRYNFLFFFCPFFYFDVDTSHGSFLIFFFPFSFAFVFGFIRGLVYLSMVCSSEVRIACPSISFLFARLGLSLGVFPHLENFVSGGNSLGIVMADLLPLLH